MTIDYYSVKKKCTVYSIESIASIATRQNRFYIARSTLFFPMTTESAASGCETIAAGKFRGEKGRNEVN